jgi:biotin transport system substrate-specific component
MSLGARAGPVPGLVPGLVLAVTAVALAARVDVPVPGSPVPQSLQTLAVVLVGAFLGPRRGMLALLLYMSAGAVGVPVFADGASGPRHLIGPTGGYLLGFVAGAGVAGLWRERGGCRRWLPCLGGMLTAHLVILAAGWGGLSLLMGPASAFASGVAPFLWGGLVKSGVAVWILSLWRPTAPSR